MICVYNIFETYFSYRGYLLAINLQTYLELRHWNVQTDYVAKNWALAMMLKALPLVHFWSVLLLKEQMMTSVRKTIKMLVWSVQNWSICSEIGLENNHKIRHFLPIAFWWSLPRKLSWNSHKIGRFFHEFVPKNPAKFGFFFRNLSEALVIIIVMKSKKSQHWNRPHTNESTVVKVTSSPITPHSHCLDLATMDGKLENLSRI